MLEMAKASIDLQQGSVFIVSSPLLSSLALPSFSPLAPLAPLSLVSFFFLDALWSMFLHASSGSKVCRVLHYALPGLAGEVGVCVVVYRTAPLPPTGMCEWALWGG